ncbi:MAG: NAD(P)H-dependent oxidoreductase [Chlorobi bacterium]|nr:NAD(P)H-dependent oxidoreductase [Chlorobiota bacterium]MCI0716071.1 NAD(P)H-dependent oxidoreductase [Chlorobiota bacterium]
MNFIPTIPKSELPENSHKIASVGNRQIALFNYNGEITALGNACLHKGGPIGKGRVYYIKDELCVECPWHGWQYNVKTGKAPGGYLDQQAVFEVKIEDDMIMVSEKTIVNAKAAQHDHPEIADLVQLKYETGPGTMNVLGISTTNLNKRIPRPSTSEEGLNYGLELAEKEFGAKTKMLKLRDLEFRHCEGYYSLHEKACTWPCSITDKKPDDGMTEIYRGLILWADVVLVATPIRWGNASSLYYKMCERLNCVQNQITLYDKVLIKNKVAGFIITGGQDNIQQVAGQMNVFFTELGFAYPPFNFVGWSRGWISEDMEHNIEDFRKSRYMKRSIKELVSNTINMSRNFKQMDCTKLDAPLPKRKDKVAGSIQ